MNNKIGVGINLKTLEILSKYLPKDKALEATKELMLVEYDVRQDLKNTIVRELYGAIGYKGGVTCRTVESIDRGFDYSHIVAHPEKLEFLGIPTKYLE